MASTPLKKDQTILHRDKKRNDTSAENVSLQVKAGHGNSSTIIVLTKNPDKAQIYYISSKAAGELKEGHTPRMVCEYIVNEMKADIEDMKGPVLNMPEKIDPLRVIAKGLQGKLADELAGAE